MPHPCGNQKPFSHHNVFPLPTPFVSFMFFVFPPMVIKTLLVTILCDSLIKKGGVTNGNPLGTCMEHVGNKWKNEKQSFFVDSEI
jgi:hypothetical protein